MLFIKFLSLFKEYSNSILKSNKGYLRRKARKGLMVFLRVLRVLCRPERWHWARRVRRLDRGEQQPEPVGAVRPEAGRERSAIRAQAIQRRDCLCSGQTRSGDLDRDVGPETSGIGRHG